MANKILIFFLVLLFAFAQPQAGKLYYIQYPNYEAPEVPHPTIQNYIPDTPDIIEFYPTMWQARDRSVQIVEELECGLSDINIPVQVISFTSTRDLSEKLTKVLKTYVLNQIKLEDE